MAAHLLPSSLDGPHMPGITHHHLFILTTYLPLPGSGDGDPRSQSALPGPHSGCHQQGDQPGLDSDDWGQLSGHHCRGGGVQCKSHSII